MDATKVLHITVEERDLEAAICHRPKITDEGADVCATCIVAQAIIRAQGLKVGEVIVGYYNATANGQTYDISETTPAIGLIMSYDGGNYAEVKTMLPFDLKLVPTHTN